MAETKEERQAREIARLKELESHQISFQMGAVLKKRLSGILLQPTGTKTEPIHVNASYDRPEKWIKERQAPDLNITLLGVDFDPGRFSTSGLERYTPPSPQDVYGDILQKPSYIPAVYFYEIRFIVLYGQHMLSLTEQIFRRLPPFGFGAFLEFDYRGDKLECPFELADDKSIFARYGETDDNREFEKTLRYRVQSWIDTSPDFTSVPIIEKVTVEYNVTGRDKNYEE